MRLLHAARLSQKEDGQTGIDSADLHVGAWAIQNGHEIIATAADHKSSQSRPWDRKNLKPWVTDPAKIALYDGIVAYRFDRLSRGDDECTSEIQDWARKHKKVLLTEDGLQYPCEGVEGIRWDVTKRIAHEEWLKIRERYIRMQKYLRSQNYLVGKAPFGFQIVQKDGHKTLAPVPELKSVLREMVARAIKGDSLASICRYLEQEGIPPRHTEKWSEKTVSQILRNQSLIGRRTPRKARGKTELRFESVISIETYNTLIAKLDSNARRRGAISSDPAMLTEVIYCLKCKGVMHRRRFPRKGKEYLYYRCDGTEYSRSQCKNMVPMGDVDAWVDSYFTVHMGDEERQEIIMVAGQDYQDELDQNKRDIDELDVDADDYIEQVTELRAIRKELRERPVEPGRVEMRGTGELFRDFWPRLSTIERRQFLLDTGMKVYATKTKYELWMADNLVGIFGE